MINEISWYENLLRFLHPYRYFLLAEIVYLKSQLASQTRRADIAVEQLLAYKSIEIERKPIPKIVKPPIDPADLKGLGWANYQATKLAIQNRLKEQQNVKS